MARREAADLVCGKRGVALDVKDVVLPEGRLALPERRPSQVVRAVVRREARDAVRHRVEVAADDVPRHATRRRRARVVQDVRKLPQPSDRAAEDLEVRAVHQQRPPRRRYGCRDRQPSSLPGLPPAHAPRYGHMHPATVTVAPSNHPHMVHVTHVRLM